MHTTHGKSTHVYHVSRWNLYLQTDLPSSTFKETLVSTWNPKISPKRHLRCFGHLPDFIKRNYHKSGDQMAPPSHNSRTSTHKIGLNISQPFIFQAFQVTSQEPKLRYNQLDTPAMTKRKRCHSVVFIVRLGPSAPFTNHKSSRKYHVFFDMFFP